MAITPNEIAGVLSAGGYDAASFAATMQRLAALDAYNKLASALAVLRAEHAEQRAAMAAAESTLEAQVAAARAAADEVVGGGA